MSLLWPVGQVDLTAVFADKVMKTVMKHVEIISKARTKGRTTSRRAGCEQTSEHTNLLTDVCLSASVKVGDSLEHVGLQEYGSDLHVALQSRRDELLYLRTLTDLLFPHLLPSKATDCRYPSEPVLVLVQVSNTVLSLVQVSGSAAAGGDGWVRHPADHGLHGWPGKSNRTTMCRTEGTETVLVSDCETFQEWSTCPCLQSSVLVDNMSSQNCAGPHRSSLSIIVYLFVSGYCEPDGADIPQRHSGKLGWLQNLFGQF